MAKENLKVRADITFNPEKCIGCGACSRVCPTDAIIALKNHGKGSLNYNHSFCLYCRRCAGVCPEGAIRYGGVVESCGTPVDAALPEEKLEFEYQECDNCGTLFLPLAMMDRVSKTLKVGEGKLSSMLGLCPECRTRELFDRTWTVGKSK